MKKIGSSFLLMFLFVAVMLFFSCSSPWVAKEKQLALGNKYSESKVYRLKKDLRIDINRHLKKGSEVKIYFVYASSWVKVYAYPKSQDRLQANPILAIFLLKNDAPDKKFNEEKLDTEFRKVFE